jgi:UDP-glucose 4-epimerase
MEKLLVTGANGFVGAALCRELTRRGIPFIGSVRKHAGGRPARENEFETSDLSVPVDWRPALAGCDVVIHLAARVHMMREQLADPLSVYRAVNVDATMRLARQAAELGTRRFVFVSSVKVNGERTTDRAFSAGDVPQPEDAYGKSKLEAEQALQEWSARSGVELVIVRPPLVYGQGVRANFLRLMQLVQSGVPLPLGSVHNLRSMVALDNLVDFLLLCAAHPAAAGSVWMVSDQQDVSISQLIRLIARAMNKPARLFPVPPGLLAASAAILGRRAAAGRLLDSLQVDAGPAVARLGWTPPLDVENGIRRTVAHFLAQAGQ